MLYGKDFDRISSIMEADAIITNPQPELWWVDALKTLDITLAGSEQPGQSVQDPNRGPLLESTKLRPRQVAPDDPFSHS
jgi:hypothetical protein